MVVSSTKMPFTFKVVNQIFRIKGFDITNNLDDFGYRIVAAKDVPADALIVSCPASLIITPGSSRSSVLGILAQVSNLLADTSDWVERQWIATYLSLHWIIGDHEM
jgi:hypothetical protein